MIAHYPDRLFQLWEYRVSHGSLLIRSPKGLKASHNVDLVFVGVEFLAAPRMLQGLAIEQAAADDVARVRAAFGEVEPPARVYVLVSRGRRHVVVAAGFRLDENEVDIFDSPF